MILVELNRWCCTSYQHVSTGEQREPMATILTHVHRRVRETRGLSFQFRLGVNKDIFFCLCLKSLHLKIQPNCLISRPYKTNSRVAPLENICYRYLYTRMPRTRAEIQGINSLCLLNVQEGLPDLDWLAKFNLIRQQ